MVFVNEGPVTWHTVSAKLQSWSEEISPLQKQSLMIAVSAELTSPSLGLSSTGMYWSHCIYDISARMYIDTHTHTTVTIMTYSHSLIARMYIDTHTHTLLSP